MSSPILLITSVLILTFPSDTRSLQDNQRLHDSSYDMHASPLRTLNKQTATVNLLPNKMNVSELSGQQTSDRRSRGTSVEEDSLSLDSVGHVHVPCSDPDFIRNAKPGGKATQSLPLSGRRRSAGYCDTPGVMVSSPSDGHSPKVKSEITPAATPRLSSPLLSRRSRLAPPQVKRSSSMTRLSEAINQIHNLCVFPAQPVTITQVSFFYLFLDNYKFPAAEMLTNICNYLLSA